MHSISKTPVAPALANSRAVDVDDGNATARRALVALRGPLDAAAITTAAASAQGVLALLEPDLVVFAFEAQSEAASLRRAVAFARRETTAEVSAIIDLAPIKIRQRGDRTIVRSAALRRVVVSHCDPLPMGQGYSLAHELEAAAGTTTEAACRGRDELLAEASAAFSRALSSRRPLTMTLVGETGMGKSRALLELAGALESSALAGTRAGARAGARAAIIHVSGSGGRAAESKFLLELFGAAPMPPAISFRLERGDASDAEIAPLLAAPGAMRHALGREIAARAVALASKNGPLLIAVDDGHRIDHAIHDGLELARRVDEEAQGGPQRIECMGIIEGIADNQGHL